MKSLAEMLGVPDPKDVDLAEKLKVLEPYADMDGGQFSEAVLNSPDFRLYVILHLRLGTLPPAVLTRLMDHAKSWGKVPNKMEHTGADGKPIQVVTEVRRVIVRADEHDQQFEQQEPARAATTH